MNPAEVPFESITGIEAIAYKGSFDLVSHEGEGPHHYEVSIGGMARYNTALKAVTPGADIAAIVGPFSLGAAEYHENDLVPSSLPATANVSSHTVEHSELSRRLEPLSRLLNLDLRSS